MNFKDTLQLSFRSVKQNATRTVITCCIIGFGIMALVGILTAIDGLKTYLNKDFSSMGANSFKIRNRALGISFSRGSEPPKEYRPISLRETEEFKKYFRMDRPVAIQLLCSPTSVVKYYDKKSNPNNYFFGVDENYLEAESYSLVWGRNFSVSEINAGTDVCILGFETGIKMFGEELRVKDPYVTVDGRRYLVIGIMESKGTSLVTTDNLVLVPLNNARQYYLGSEISYVLSILSDGPEDLPLAEAEAISAMRLARKQKPLEDNNFDILKSDSISELLVEKLEYATIGGFIIGVITLLGAAIGLMNIMLVSVTERTKEIGTLKAIGATPRSILSQFLLEAIVICQLGGGLGILLGLLMGNLVSLLVGGSFVMPWNWIILGVSFCLIVGLISGIYPAFKASKLDPVEALRYE